MVFHITTTYSEGAGQGVRVGVREVVLQMPGTVSQHEAPGLNLRQTASPLSPAPSMSASGEH